MSNKAFVDFDYKGEKHEIECTKDEKMSSICEKLANELGKDLKEFDFLYLEEALDQDLTFEQCLNKKNEKEAPK